MNDEEYTAKQLELKEAKRERNNLNQLIIQLWLDIETEKAKREYKTRPLRRFKNEDIQKET